MPDLAGLIRGLSPGGLQLFRRQLASLPEFERQRAYSRLSGIPELSDVVGRPAQPQQAIGQTDIPFWQKALSTVTAPFRWIEEEVTKPFGAIVTSPWTPAVAGTEEMGWLERERAEYEAWEDPALKIPFTPDWKIGIKGIVETLPWLAVPSAAGVAGKLGQMAAMGGRLGRGAALAGKVVSPLAKAERIATYPVAKPLEKIVEKIAPKVKYERVMYRGTRGKPVDEGMYGKGTYFSSSEEYAAQFGEVTTSRVTLQKPFQPKTIGELDDIGNPIWLKAREKGLSYNDALEAKSQGIRSQLEKQGYDGIVLPKTPSGYQEAIVFHPEKAVKIIPKAKAKIPPPPPIKPPPAITTQAVPEGFGEPQQLAIEKLTKLVKESKPLRKETEALYTQERAIRISKYEEALEQGAKQGLTPEQAHLEALGRMSKEYPRADITKEFETLRAGMTEDEVQTLFGIVQSATYPSSFDRINTFTALQDILLNKIPQTNQIRLLEETFGSGLAKQLLKKRPWGVRAGDFVLDLANAPRALLASCDISGLLRQGAILTARHPIEGIKTVRPMLRAMLSDKNSALMDNIIRTRTGMDELLNPSLRVRIELTSIPSKEAAMLTQFEEAFASKIMNKVFFVRASNRAYVTVLNDLRSRSALNVLSSWKKAGIRYTKEDLADLNQLVNWASGRGTLPKAIQKQGKLLNALFFAPRLQFSRFQLPTTVLPAITKSSLVRKEAWRTILSFLGAGSGILTMAAMSGQGTVELDPRSADFGKLKIGETRLDIWTGYSQLARFLTQLTLAQRKSVGGRVYGLNRRDVAIRFAQTKASPATGFINDLLSGETYLGEEMPPKSAMSVFGQMYQRMMPLAIQDLVDGVNQDGPLGGIVSSVGLMGVGVVTYTDEVKKERNKAAEAQYGMTWEELGRTQGRAAQLRLEQTTPAILEAEKEEEKRFATGSPSTMTQWHNEGDSIEESYRRLVTQATKKFQATGDGRAFREEVNFAAQHRREAYAARSKREEYVDIVAYYDQPLKPDQIAKMNPGDVIRREYNQRMYGADMYDQFGDYLFDEADRREQEFLKKYGQQALDYIEEYRGSRWLDKPVELKMLEQARDTLRPYWQIVDAVWSLYPPELKTLADQIAIMERTDPDRARQMLRRYPAILRARELVARYRKAMRDRNPVILQAHRMFYG